MNAKRMFEKFCFSPAPVVIFGFGITMGLYAMYKAGQRVSTENATNKAAKSFVEYAKEADPKDVMRTVKTAASKDISLDRNVNALRNAVNAYKDIAAAVVISGALTVIGGKLIGKRYDIMRSKLRNSRITCGQMRRGIDGIHGLMCDLTNSMEALYSGLPNSPENSTPYFDGLRYGAKASRRMVEHALLTSEECFCPWNKHDTINA